MAISRASKARSAQRVLATRQPTMVRENTLSLQLQYLACLHCTYAGPTQLWLSPEVGRLSRDRPAEVERLGSARSVMTRELPP